MLAGRLVVSTLSALFASLASPLFLRSPRQQYVHLRPSSSLCTVLTLCRTQCPRASSSREGAAPPLVDFVCPSSPRPDS